MQIGCTSEPNDFKNLLNDVLVRSLQTQIYIMVSNVNGCMTEGTVTFFKV